MTRAPGSGRTGEEKLSATELIRASRETGDPFLVLSRAGLTELHQSSLTAALHSLGDLLHYPDDEELCDLVVLRPQWLTAYISRVLDSEEVLNEGGLFRHTFGHTRWRWRAAAGMPS